MNPYVAGVRQAVLEKIAKIEDPGLVAGASLLPLPLSGPIAAAILADKGQRGEAFWKTLGGQIGGILAGGAGGGLLGAIPAAIFKHPSPVLGGALLGTLIGLPVGSYLGAKAVD